MFDQTEADKTLTETIARIRPQFHPSHSEKTILDSAKAEAAQICARYYQAGNLFAEGIDRTIENEVRVYYGLPTVEESMRIHRTYLDSLGIK